uniref:Uncharacterized protein n=1 Tax=Parascaris equorum TaxID=6256 RepID=A0A914S9E2_PAREQ
MSLRQWLSYNFADRITMGSPGDYGCSVEELRTLMEYRSSEAREKIDTDYNGIEGLCKRLKTDPANGLPQDNDELDRRRAVFVSAIVSLALSFYTPPDDGTGLQAKIETEHKFAVIRGGNQIQIVVNELVVGDIAQIKYGSSFSLLQFFRFILVSFCSEAKTLRDAKKH